MSLLHDQSNILKRYVIFHSIVSIWLKLSILKHFDLETPVLNKNVYPRVSDIPLKTPVYIYPNEPIYKAAQLLWEKEIRTLPVVDEHFHIVGIIGETDLARYFVDKITLATPIMPIHIHTLVKALEGRILANSQKKEVLKGKIVLAVTQKGTILQKKQARKPYFLKHG
jgi:manganese-dependent inorganic pyrophosphatase